MIAFRSAGSGDVVAVLELLRDDTLGAGRETADFSVYEQAFARISGSDAACLVVGEAEGRVVACYLLSVLDGLSMNGMRRAHVEDVRVASELRGQGYGAALMADMEARARELGCGMLQLLVYGDREGALRFYEGHGFVGAHVGMRKVL